MKLELEYGNKEYNIELGSITQICGENVRLKRQVLSALCEYFSSARITEGSAPIVTMNGNEVGRKYFKTIHINTAEDLIGVLGASKSSLLMDYIEWSLQEYDYHRKLLEIEDIALDMFNKMNEKIENDIGHLRFEFEFVSILDLIKKSSIQLDDGKSVKSADEAELLKNLLGVIRATNKYNPERVLLVVENIDHLLNRERYFEYIEEVKKVCDEMELYLLCSTSLEGYCYVSEELFPYINIVNDDVINLSEYEVITDFISENYPINVEKDELKYVAEYIANGIHQIGMDRQVGHIKSDVIVKMINRSLGFVAPKEDVNLLEIEYLRQ